ncbi:MAG: VWA domain-containing protein [Polyangiaceae bacterium]|nr:VWA domain-containing protein [Polyangiaceae bacterium]
MTRTQRYLLLIAYLCIGALIGVAWPLMEHGIDWLDYQWRAPEFAWLLLLLPLLLWRTTLGKDAHAPRLRTNRIATLKAGPLGIRAYLRDLPGALRVISLGLFVIALCRPVSILVPDTREEEGIDLVIALDLSGSMQAVMENLPEGLKRFTPQATEQGILPTRLEAAKAVLRDFIRRRHSDRIGVVVFGKDPYVVSPPTLDYQLLDSLISSMELNAIDGNGTAIGDALGVSVARLRRSEAKSKGIILLTDGDNNGSKISPEYAAELAEGLDIHIYPVQIGSGEEARVFRGFNLIGQPRYESHSFPTNPKLLQELAQTTGGEMQIAADAEKLQSSLHKILDALEKTEFEAAQSSFAEMFRFWLLPGVFVLFLEVCLSVFLLRRYP